MPKKAKPVAVPEANAGLAYLNVIIDRSGSMKSLSKETVGGFNKFLREQQDAPGKAMLRLAYFDDKVVIPVDGVNIKKAEEITEAQYWEGGGGWTALFDAIGTTIEACKKHIDSLKSEDRPSKVMFLIITDGLENSSRIFTADKIKNLVTEARETLKWEFVFLGANIDAITAAANIGIGRDYAANYSADAGGTRAVYTVASSNMIRSRGLVGGVTGSASAGFSELDREALMAKIVPASVVPDDPKK
jgi:hypothetical protein